MEDLGVIVQQQQDYAASFIESLTPAELGRLLGMKRETSDHLKNHRFESASNCKRAENTFIEEMTIKHGRELPGLSIVFLTIPVVESELARKVRDVRIAAVLGP